MHTGLLNLVFVVVFLALMAGMGVYFARRNKDTEAYFLGGRKVPGWALGISMVGNAISGIACRRICPGLAPTHPESLYASCGLTGMLAFHPVFSATPTRDCI